MKAALLALAAALAPPAAMAAPAGAAEPGALECPEALGDFIRQAREAGTCRYRSGEAEAALRLEPLNLTPGQGDEAETGAALVSSPLPGWERQRTHLGETPAGDLRRERWTAAANPRLSVTIEYAIPAFAPAQVRAFVIEAGAANGVAAAPAETAGGDEACANDLAGLTLERALGPSQAGAAVQSGCLYSGQNVSALVYAPRSAGAALEAFMAAAPPEAEEGSGPAVGGAEAHIFRADDANTGLWLASDGAQAVEIIWSGAEQEGQVEALLRAAFR